MKRLMLSGMVSLALLAIATGAMRLHSRPISATAAGTQPSLMAASPGILPVQDFDDRSLVFPRETSK